MRIENMTTHTVLLIDEQGHPTYFGPAAPSKAACVISRDAQDAPAKGGIAARLTQLVEVANLPAPREDVLYLVDSGVALLMAGTGRWDLVCVDPQSLVGWPENRGVLAYRGLLAFDGTRPVPYMLEAGCFTAEEGDR